MVNGQQSLMAHFLCPNCDIAFAISVDSLRSMMAQGFEYQCEACEFYFEQRRRWSASLMMRLWSEASAAGKFVATLPGLPEPDMNKQSKG